jgi:hypothetical protein
MDRVNTLMSIRRHEQNLQKYFELIYVYVCVKAGKATFAFFGKVREIFLP